MKKITLKSIASMLTVIMSLTCLVAGNVKAIDGENVDGEQFSQGYIKENRYSTYDETYKDAARPIRELVINGSDYTALDGAEVEKLSYQGRDHCILWKNQEGTVDYTIEIPETGRYRIALGYYPTPEKSSNVELELLINGKSPFFEAQKVAFQRKWTNQDKEFKTDNRNNQLRPTQINVPEWLEADFRDKDGIHSQSFEFYFEKGNNQISLKAIREVFALGYIKIYNTEEIVSYQEYLKQQPKNNIEGEYISLDAEKADYKSSPSLYPITDRTSSTTKPYHPSQIRLNTIGGTAWQQPGEWLEWNFEVKKAGYYYLSFRARQDAVKGMFSHRRFYIDGEVPFKELDEVKFDYNRKWQVVTLSNDNEPYKVYLDEGPHSLKIESIIGSISDAIEAVEKIIFDLNYMYRKIIMITGVTPDIYRDYDLDDKIPELKKEFIRIANELDTQLNSIELSIGKKSPEAAILNEIAVQLRDMSKDPDSINTRLEKYKNNISALSDWVATAKQQPLELDTIVISSSPDPQLKANDSFFDSVAHECKAFFYSFFTDYDSVGNTVEGKESLTVWVGSGREQAQIIKTMVDDSFTAKTGIYVNISLVQGSLLEATMAGKGPDIALNVARYLPVDLAARGALLPISEYSGFEAMKPRFQDTAFTPYVYDGKVYGVPETQEFNMMFYRTDILEELGIEPPKTWEDFYRIIPIIERNNMEIGMPSITQQAAGDTYTPFPKTFPTMLIQNGLSWYQDGLTQTQLSDPKAIELFSEYVNLYRDYGLPVYYDFANRFRSGEMPLGIGSYTTYNFLQIFAPEIRNLWEMTPIIGTLQPDGSINNGQEATGVAGVIFKKVKNKEEAYQFLDWWTSTESQTRFGREMESILGPAGRHPTANMEAFENLAWSAKEIKALKSQWKQVVEQPEVPGSYFVSRNMTNAIIETVFDGKNPIETLQKYNIYINEELERKHQELSLE